MKKQIAASPTALACWAMMTTGCTKPPSPSSSAGAPASRPSADPAAASSASPPAAAEAPARAPTVTLMLNAPWHDPATGTGFELRSLVTEEIAASPQDPEAYPAGSGVTMTLVAAGQEIELSSLSAGYDSKTVGWAHDYRVEFVDVDPARPSVAVAIDRITELTVAGSERTVELKIGEALTLAEGLTMRFDRHGHKMVMEGQRSPLIVRVTYLQGSTATEASYNLDLPDERTWRYEDHEITLVDHAYDERMTLSLRRLRLEPLAPA